MRRATFVEVSRNLHLRVLRNTMADQLTPYVNSSKLSNHLNQTVRIVGKLLKSHDNTSIIESSDGGQIQVTMNRVCISVFKITFFNSV